MSKIIDFARQQVGKPYVFGRSGPDSFDCSGLTKRAVAQIGLDWYHGATTQWLRGKEEGQENRYAYWGETGPISELPYGAVALVFNEGINDKGQWAMVHVGIYDGAGNVIQAGGQYPGVSDKPINRRYWSHYALLSPYWAEKDGITVMDGMLRRGSSGAAVRDLQTALMALGYDVGKNTKVDGKFGPATEAAVRKFQADYLIPVTGTWGPLENQTLDADLEDELGAPVNDDAEMVLVPKAWLNGLIDGASGFLRG